MSKKPEKEISINRIKKLIAKSKEFLERQIQKKEKSHAYAKRKPLPIFSFGEKNSQRKISAKIDSQQSLKPAIEQMHCSANQNYPLFFLHSLHRKKIENFKFKEQLIATRNLRKLSHEMQQWIYFKAHHKIRLFEKEPIEFYDLLEKREERHFQIDRIIKYLSS